MNPNKTGPAFITIETGTATYTMRVKDLKIDIKPEYPEEFGLDIPFTCFHNLDYVVQLNGRLDRDAEDHWARYEERQ
jgi:hypothetical protein